MYNSTSISCYPFVCMVVPAVTLSHGTIAGIVVAPVVLVAVVVAMIACLVLRQKKKRSLKASMTCRGQNVYLSDSTTDSFDSRRYI